MIKFLAVITITVFLINTLTIINVKGDDDLQVVKIGYSTNYGIIKENSIAGNEGYGFEYLNKIIEYTDKNYSLEFVECDWTTALQMLHDGELDILAPANFSPSREEDFIFSENVFANDTVFISSLDNFSFIGYDKLNGSTIAVQENYPMIDYLYSFLEENNISADILKTNIKSYVTQMEGIDYDYLLASSLQLDGQLNVVAKLGTTPTYLMAHPDNADIIADFDNAMKRIESEEYLYQERLYLKYFNYTIDDSTFVSQDEYELIHETPVYQVGYSPDYSPLTYLNSDGELVGVAIEVLDMISQDSGVKFNLIDISQMTDEFDLVDFSLLAPNFAQGYFKEKQSIAYSNYPFLLIENIDNMNINNNIGVLNFYELQEHSLDSIIKGGEITVYSNYAAMETAFKNGEIDRIILTSLLYNKSRSSLQEDGYIVSPLTQKLPILIGYNPNFPQDKIDVFNKFISRLDSNLVEYSLSEHTALMQVTNITDVIKENPIIVNAFLILLGSMLLIVLISMLKQKYDLTRMLNYDKVTNLYSQHKFIITTQKLIKKDKKYTILSVDIDNFKHINEIYGYEIGSKVLKQLAYYIKHFMKNSNLVSRGMGDGFLILLETENVVENINNGLRHTSTVLDGLNKVLNDEYNFSFSLGYYNIKDPTLDLSFMIDCANLAKNEGKKTIGTTICEYTEEMNSERIAINEVVATMNKGLENREFVVHYQPKFDLNTMKLVGAEALVRWHKNIKVVSPDHFIPIFEKNGFIEKLDYYIIESVCDFIRKNNDNDLPLISLNLSGITIMRENLVDKIVNIIEQYGISPTQLELEITESAFIDNFELGVDKLIKLRDLGFQISMDDFGAGISSLNRLKEMPIDVLKIDREFIVDSLENEKSNKIIRNIINMSKDLELETIAEGIETIEQLEFLKELGCDLGQGYYYSKPLPPYDFIKKVKSETKSNVTD